jgi:hypothetical protein
MKFSLPVRTGAFVEDSKFCLRWSFRVPGGRHTWFEFVCLYPMRERHKKMKARHEIFVARRTGSFVEKIQSSAYVVGAFAHRKDYVVVGAFEHRKS